MNSAESLAIGVACFFARNQIFVSKTTVHKYMNKELHLQCVCRRKRPGYKKGHAQQNLSKPVEPQLFGRQSIKSGAQILHMFFLRTVPCATTGASLICTTAAWLQVKPENGLRAI
jgi:hypothetical protein